MKRLFLISFFFFLLTSCNEKGSVKNKDLFSFRLFSADHSEYDLSLLKNNKASVFVFLAPDCPLSQNYSLTLNTLNNRFKKDTIGFYGIIPGNNFEKKEVENFVDKYKINFPVLSDEDLNLTACFKASKTPEVFVVNGEEKILYKGAIDNWASDLGVHRAVITERYLEDALNSIVQNIEIRVKETKAAGCFIERKR
jgi:peroxiredoxin